MDVMKLAGRLARVIDEKGLNLRAEDLTEHEGVGEAKATLILAAIEFARRRLSEAASKHQITPEGFFVSVHAADSNRQNRSN